MDWPLIVAGVLFLTWPWLYRDQIRRIERKVGARGGDPDAFHRHMDRPWIRAALWIVPVLGAVAIALGVAG